MVYVSHTCHNSECQRAFMDVDSTHTRSKSPDWKYCPECVAKGLINPDKKPISDIKEKLFEKMRINNQSQNIKSEAVQSM